MPGVTAAPRRAFLRQLAVLAGAGLLGCRADPAGPAAADSDGRLAARPGTPTRTPTPGLSSLGLGSGRDGQLYVPATYSPLRPAPLLVLLHGAGGHGADWQPYAELAAARGLLLLTPDSRYRTWDLILGQLGPDLEFLDAALQHTFDRCRVDTGRIGLGGFSDGASWALSIGAANGDLFSHLVGFSPGSYRPPARVGTPQVFVAHGVSDTVLSVTRSRGDIVPRLRADGCAVTYREFQGGHTVPRAVALEALDGLVGAALVD